jgi:hypothetical protein
MSLLDLLISLEEADFRTDGTFVVVYHYREPTEEEAEAIRHHKQSLVSLLRRVPRRKGKGKGTPPDPNYLAWLKDHPPPNEKPKKP